MFPRAVLTLPITIALLCALVAGPAFPADLSMAFFYAQNPPVDELKAFDIVVVSPEAGLSPSEYRDGKSELFAYLSLGEVTSSAPYLPQLRAEWIIGSNPAWKSKIVDLANPSWRRFFIDQLVAPLWAQGYRGFFLDTLDSYQLAVKEEQYPRMEAGLLAIIRELKQRYPDARLVLNRGFEVIDRLQGQVLAVAAESLFRGYSEAKGGYYEIDPSDREWLLGKLRQVRDLGLPVIAIDYLPPGARQQARELAEKIKELGFIPWVADKDLASLGVGSLEVLPRKILGLYDGRGGDPAATNLLRYGATPLNYLGYTLELHDLQAPLPEMIMAGRYAGMLVWPLTEQSGGAPFKPWLVKRLQEGVRVAFLDSFGLPPVALPKELKLRVAPTQALASPLRVVGQDAMVGFEVAALPQIDLFVPLKTLDGRSLLQIANREGEVSDAAAITPWGGYALSPFAVLTALGDRAAWVIDPFEFFQQALNLPDIPVPDVTTENGTRLLLVQVDGDGFDRCAQWPGGGSAAEELRRRILEKYPLATSVSVPTSAPTAAAQNPGGTEERERQARKIFLLPWVEAAGREGEGSLSAGETRITESYPSLTAVGPLGVWRQGHSQVFAPNQTATAYVRPETEGGGYQRVLETFRLTDSPRRLKPVSLHYPFDSATRQGSLTALDQVYSWALGAGLNSQFASAYRQKVEDFNRTVVARKGDGWLVRNQGALRELRIPAGLGFPDLETSRNVAGFNQHLGQRYIHLGPGGEAEIRLGAEPGRHPRLAEVNGTLTALKREGRGLGFGLKGETDMRLSLAESDHCALRSGTRTLSPIGGPKGAAVYDLSKGEYALRIECR